MILAQKTGLPELAARVMVGRGVKTEQELSVYAGAYAPAKDPYALRDMDKAVARIRQGLARQEAMVVYGDYDCDGVMATVMLLRCLRDLGGRVEYYIPSREKEGYGLNKDALERLQKKGVTVVITVDNGISAIDEIALAAEMGIDVVVTDHHQPRPQLPEAAAAVVNPHRMDDDSGCEMLCGAGVAYKLCCALTGKHRLEELDDLLALATVADVVPLVGENRTYVQEGLWRLAQTKNAGLRQLMRLCGLGENGKSITSESIMFGIAPRINCAGRFDRVDEVMALLMETGKDAQALAEGIEHLNQKRRAIEDEIFQDIHEQLNADPQRQNARVIVVCGEGWHHGVLGIVASRVVRRYGRPCILLGFADDAAKGSGRSIEGFSLIEMLMACDQYLHRYGGHAQAVGLTIQREQIEAFEQAANRWAQERYPVMVLPELMLDCEIPAKALTVERFAALGCLAPFGCGNQSPLFLMRGCTLQECCPISENRHLRLRFSQGGESFWTVYFGVGREGFPYREGDVLDLAVRIEVDVWKRERRLSVKLQDVRCTQLLQEELLRQQDLFERMYRGEWLSEEEKREVSPTRQDVQEVYAWIRREGDVCRDAAAALLRLGKSDREMGKVLFSLMLLEELEVLRKKEVVGGERLCCGITKKGKALEDTGLWKRIWSDVPATAGADSNLV